jgi:hypothetical protein
MASSRRLPQSTGVLLEKTNMGKIEITGLIFLALFAMGIIGNLKDILKYIRISNM